MYLPRQDGCCLGRCLAKRTCRVGAPLEVGVRPRKVRSPDQLAAAHDRARRLKVLLSVSRPRSRVGGERSARSYRDKPTAPASPGGMALPNG
jgi:hypothetical protein